MIDITLYRYEREPNKITVSTEMPDKPYTTLHRLVADGGMILYKDGIETPCIDVESIESWQEKVYSEDEIIPDGEISNTEALAIITGGAM